MAKLKGKQIVTQFTGSYEFTGSIALTGSLLVSGSIEGVNTEADSGSFSTRITANETDIVSATASILQNETDITNATSSISDLISDSGSFSTRVTKTEASSSNISSSLQTHITNTSNPHSTIFDDLLNKPTLVSGSSQIDHDITTNFVENEHIDWTSATESISIVGDVTASKYKGDGSALTNISVAGGTKIIDTDMDTYVDTEDTADVDEITFVASGSQIALMKYNRLDVKKDTYITGSLNVSNVIFGMISSSAQIDTEISGAFTNDSASLAQRITDATASILQNETDITNATASISDLVSASGSDSTRITDLETASGSFSTRVTTNEGDISSNDIDIANATASIVQLVLDVASATASILQNETDITDATASISDLVSDSGSFSTRVTTNETDITNLQSDSGSFSTRVTANETDITNATASIAQLVTDVSDATASIVDFGTRISNEEATSSALITDFANVQNLDTDADVDFNTVTTVGDIVAGGNIYADEFHATYVSSSIIYISGSTKFGDTSDDRHDFTGSIYVQGIIDGMISGSAQIATEISGAFDNVSSSLATRITDATASILQNETDITNAESRLQQIENVTGSHATTGSNIFIGDQTITGSVNINDSIYISQSLEIHHIDFTDSVSPEYVPGRVFYDSEDKTIAIYSDVHSGSLQIGQETWAKIVNKTGATILNGQAVYVSGAQGNRPTAGITDTLIESSSLLIGLATHDIADNLEGYITTYGFVRDVDTVGFEEGDVLYLSGSNGSYTSSVQPPPHYSNKVGHIITVHASQGIILVSPTIADEIISLHGVSNTATNADGNLLVFNSVSTIWSGSNTRGLSLTDSKLIYTGSLDVSGTILGMLSSSAQIGTEISGAFTDDSASLAQGIIDATASILQNETDITNATASISDLVSDSGSFSTRVTTNEGDITNAESRLQQIENITGSHATTGSNTFYGQQIITGSLYLSGSSLISASINADNNTITNIGHSELTTHINSLIDVASNLSIEKQDLFIVSASGMHFDMEAQGGGDIEYHFGDTISTLDCTTGGGVGGRARVTLISGSDANTPATNYLYVSGSPVSTLYTSQNLPTGEFAWVGKVIIPDAVTYATTGPYVFQRYTESTLNELRGALSHQREKLRALGAVYISGVTQTLNITINGGAADNVHLATGAGSVYQLHRQAFPAFSTGSYFYGNGQNQYEEITDLNAALADQDGNSLSATRFNLIIWGAVNYSSNECKLFVNLPTDSYAKNADAIADSNNTADYSVPDDMKSVAFLIARIALRHTTAASGTWTELGTYSLLGTPPGVRSGGAGAVASNEFDDSQFRIYDDSDATKEIAFQAGSISTGTTRTLTVQDANGTIAFTSDLLGLVSSSAQIATEISGAFAGPSGSFSTRVTDLETASGSFSTRVTVNETGITNATASIAQLVTDMSDATASIADIVTDIANATASISDLVSASGSFSTRVTANETDITNLQSDSGSFSTRVTANETDITNATASIAQNVTDILNLQIASGSFAVTGSNAFIGDQIISGSLVLSGSFVSKASTIQTLSAATQLTVTNRRMKIQSNSGAVTLTGTPTIHTGSVLDGTEVILQGVSDTNYVRFQDSSSLAGSALKLQNGVDFYLAKGDILALLYDEDVNFWYELYRSDN